MSTHYGPGSLHEAEHVAGGADDIDSALDARAIALTAQGEIVYHAAAANTLAVLAVGVAGQALLTGGPAANPTWGAPAPAAHVLATTGPHTGTLPLTDLVVGARGEIITRTVADWAALGVGAANQALLSGGAGADVSWGAPPPAAHEATHVAGGADDIDSALDARALGLTAQGEIVYHAAAANTLATLAVGVAGQALLSGGPAANVSWGAPAPAAHESTHVSGGADDIDSALDGRAITLTTQGDLVYASGVNTLARLGAGTAGQILVTGGAGANPAWSFTHQLDSAPDVDSTGNGLTAIVTVGENVVEGDVLFLQNDGKYWKADADAAATMPAKVMATAAIAADATGVVLHIGYYRDDDRWNWTPGAGEANLLFVHTTAGDMVQLANQPAGAGDQVQVVGYIVDANTVFFNPSYELVEIA